MEGTPLFEGFVELTTLQGIFITGIFLSSLYAMSSKAA